MRKHIRIVGASALAVLVGVGGAALPVGGQHAAAVSTSVVINEVYGGGGNSGAAFNRDFVELYNLSSEPVTLDGMTLTYYSASGNTGGNLVLDGSIAPGGYFLVAAAAGNNTALPGFAYDAEASFNMSGTQGSVELVNADGAVVDLIGYGAASKFEGAPAEKLANALAAARKTPIADTDDNSVDFVVGDPTPQKSESSPVDPTDPEPNPGPKAVTIAEVQGTGDASPLVGEEVIVEGVVTAAYPTGGKNGFYLQTPGAVDPATHRASTAVFVFARNATAEVSVGDSVRVTGKVSEYFEQTQITSSSVTPLGSALGTVEPTAIAWPETDEERERYEGMLLQPTGDFVVSETYNLGVYGEIVLAADTAPALQPTEVAAPGTAEAIAVEERNVARRVLLDDGASLNFGDNAAAKLSPLPYLSLDTPISVGAPVTFSKPVILDYGFNEWRFQPQTHQIGTLNPVAAFGEVREQTPAKVGGDITVGSFNVLNYFIDLGQDEPGCRAYPDREGNPVATNYCNVRGAYSTAAFEQQEKKIVSAINAFDASVIALQEIENSARYGKERDATLAHLVEQLNAAAGAERWAYAPSPKAVPEAGEDVIRTAFIYQPAEVAYVPGSSVIDDDPNFSNARAPLASAFTAVQNPDVRFVAIANHFKSKGSGDSATGDNVEDTRGAAYTQGSWNGDRVRQAEAVVAFAEEQEKQQGTDLLFLIGDFNSYSFEDPLQKFSAAGYERLSSPGEYSYAYKGRVGSLDHIFASPAAHKLVEGVDVWRINATEPLALEYSRNNYNITDLYSTDAFRSSDHNPVLAGISIAAPAPGPGPQPGPGTKPGGVVAPVDTGQQAAPTAKKSAAPDTLSSTGTAAAPYGMLLALALLGAGAVVFLGSRRAAARARADER